METTAVVRTDSLSSDSSATAYPMEFPKETPPEMMPILTLLHSHQQRDYNEGYLMILTDLNSGMFTSLLQHLPTVTLFKIGFISLLLLFLSFFFSTSPYLTY